MMPDNDNTRYVRLPNGEFVPESEAMTPVPSEHAPDGGNLPQVPEDDFEFVRMPDGSIRAVSKSQIQRAETFKSDAPPADEVVEDEDEFYVHLADGSVVRAKKSDLPAASGTNAPFGFWQRGNLVYQITNVYPVENVVEGKTS